jgi:hypothetical protein
VPATVTGLQCASVLSTCRFDRSVRLSMPTSATVRPSSLTNDQPLCHCRCSRRKPQQMTRRTGLVHRSCFQSKKVNYHFSAGRKMRRLFLYIRAQKECFGKGWTFSPREKNASNASLFNKESISRRSTVVHDIWAQAGLNCCTVQKAGALVGKLCRQTIDRQSRAQPQKTTYWCPMRSFCWRALASVVWCWKSR